MGQQRDRAAAAQVPNPALEEIQGQMDSILSHLPYKCYLEEVASMGDWLKIPPWVASRLGSLTQPT